MMRREPRLLGCLRVGCGQCAQRARRLLQGTHEKEGRRGGRGSAPGRNAGQAPFGGRSVAQRRARRRSDRRKAGAQAAAGPIADLLERGLPSELTIAALDTLGDVEAESSSKSIAWYVAHRNANVRQAAVKALARTKGPVAVSALRHALSDGDAAVRGMAATGLGALKAKEAVRDLFVALDHHVGEAAASIGQLCAPAECDELAAKLGKLAFDVVSGGLDQILFRPSAEIDDDEKVKLVGRVRELGTSEANKFLKDVQKRWPATWSARVKQAIDQGVLATTVSQ